MPTVWTYCEKCGRNWPWQMLTLVVKPGVANPQSRGDFLRVCPRCARAMKASYPTPSPGRVYRNEPPVLYEVKQ